jgi:hypothetical protein
MKVEKVASHAEADVDKIVQQRFFPGQNSGKNRDRRPPGWL